MPRRRIWNSLILPAAFLLGSGMAGSSASAPFGGEIFLKTATPVSTANPESWIRFGDALVVHNVAQPTLTPFLPAKGKANGAAIVIAPGGGFMMLSMNGEGWDVARWLASKGITAFVLKYRLDATPTTPAGLFAMMAGRLGRSDFTSAPWFADAQRVATEDAKEAMRTVRANAAKWNIDPNKVGFMGFSAGAFTTLSLVNTSDAATMPNFVAPIYGPLGTPAAPLPAAPPPMWTSIASDDPLLGQTDFGLINAWRAKGGAVEFHLYEKGGHGYGFAGTPGTTTVNWRADFLAWLQSHQLYRPEGEK
jgi:acetyl esterase/lipase